MKMRRLLSCIMALLLAVSLPVSVLSADWYLEDGDITVNAPAEGGQTVTQGSNNPVSDSAPVITQRDSSTSTDHTVTIEAGAGATANVTLDGVNIDTSSAGKAAITIEGDGNVTIELDGTNTVQSGKNHAGVEKNNEGSLTIQDETGTAGSLEATGGIGGAGIGGGKGSDGSDITISGGTVEANGGENAAGIGGGVKNDACDGGNGSNISISGGTVTANGGINGAGIGGASGGNGSDIAISDGNVTATGGEGGSGIGGGAYGQGSNITISGGTVDATGGTDAAGIGGGERANGSDITISGGTVTAIGGDAPSYENGDKIEKGEGGGAGIGGGAYGTGDNIAIKNNAQVTAEGKGYAADIGEGNSEGSTVKQTNKVDLSGLSSFGKVNGVSGSNGSNLGEGNSGGVGIYSDDDDTIWGNTGAKGITASDIDGNDLSSAIRLKEDSMEVSVKEDNVLVSGNKADLLQLTVEGVKQINLETNRVNVSVSSEVLNKITSTGGSFQLTAADTTVSLTTTDQNNKKTLDMTLSANKLSDTQAVPGQSSKQPVTVSIDSQSKTGNNSAGSTLEVTTNASDATLSYSEKCIQSLLDSEFSKLVLSVGNVIATTDSQLAANTTVNGSGSITISDTTVNMNGFKFSAGDSSENDKLADMVNTITFTMENPTQGSSMMVAAVDAKASMQAASLEVPGSVLQSLMDQGVEETALSVNGKTTSINNSDLREQIDDSKPGIPAAITVKGLNILVP